MYNYLSHHGIKGQKWGVRRFQNPDGTYTTYGKQRRNLGNNVKRNKPYTKDVNEIVDTLTDKEKELLGAPLHEKWIEPDVESQTLVNKAKTIVQREGNTPVSFIELWTDESTTAQIAIATRNDPKYRGKGYADMNVEQAIKWTEKYGNTSIKELQWIAENSNTKSLELAKKHGFVKDKVQNYDDYTYFTRKNPNFSTLKTSTDIYKKAKAEEPRITRDIQNTGAKLHGLEHRLKTKESIDRKLNKEIDEERVTVNTAASGIKDAVRYTTLSSDKNFVKNYNIFKEKMSEKGYEEVRCKNNWNLYNEGKVKHKSVQSVFETPDGYLFEVQFQTPSSQKAKDLKVPIYEERRKVGIDSQKAHELEQKMIKLAEDVPNPPGIETIKTYDKHRYQK